MGEEVRIFDGRSVVKGKDASLNYSFTRHVGGDFDARVIGPGGAFILEYMGARDGMDLAILSHSGSCRWARVKPDAVEEIGENTYRATFGFDSFSKEYGMEFSYLDDIRGISNVETEMTLLKIAYIPGSGAPVDDGEGVWRKPDTGIAFIGDSIVENVFFNCGDFNTLLKRDDCVNFGIGAQTTIHCLKRIGELAGRNFRQMVVLCGINDIGWNCSAEEIAGRIGEMCTRMRAENEGISFVIISVLPTGEAIFKNDQHRIRELNEKLKALAAQHGDIEFVDVYPLFLGEDGYCRPELVLDGLHPNAEGYRIIAEKLTDYLK